MKQDNQNVFFPIAGGDISEVRRILNRRGKERRKTGSSEAIIDTWPLHFALMNCKTNLAEMASLLVSYGADPNDCTLTNPAASALMVAISLQLDQKVALALMDSGADINKQIWNGRTALHASAMSGNIGQARFLLEQGARADLADNDGLLAENLASHHSGRNSPIACMLRAVKDADEMEQHFGQGEMAQTNGVERPNGGMRRKL